MPEKLNPRMEILPNTRYCVLCIQSSNKNYRLDGEIVYLTSGPCLFDRQLNEDKKSPFILRGMKEKMFGIYERTFFDSNLVTFKEEGTPGKHNCLHLGYSGLSFVHDDEITFISHVGQKQRLDLKNGIVEREGVGIPWNEFVERVQKQNSELEKIETRPFKRTDILIDEEGWINILKKDHMTFHDILDKYT